MKEARNLVDLEPVLCRETELTEGLAQEDSIAEELFMTTEEILESLDRSDEDVKAGRCCDTFEPLARLRGKYNV